MSDDAALLQELLDERDIRRVLISIGRTVDEGDFEATAALYSRDGEHLSPWGRHRGREGLAEYIRRDLSAFPAMHHVSAGHEIDVSEDRTRANARMTLLATHVLNSEGTAFTTLGGHYEVELVREDDRWRLSRVSLHPAWRFETEGSGHGSRANGALH